MDINQVYRSKWINLIAMGLVMMGGLLWGIIGIFGWNPTERFPILQLIIGVATVYLVCDRNTYLPFLGDAAYPCNSLVDKVPTEATIEVEVQVPPNAKVVYWASEHSKLDVAPNPWEAYKNYDNTGVVTADASGHAKLKIRPPTPYKTPMGRLIDPHVHYRYCQIPGMLSQIETVTVKRHVHFKLK